MQFLTYLSSFLIPRTIEVVSSRINGQISVELWFGSYRLSVERYWQSGKYAANLLGRAIKAAKIPSEKVKNVLVLGLGGGSVVGEINQGFPQSKITGIEIDPQMAMLGKKYINLDKAKNLTIIIDDAAYFVAKAKTRGVFDMIVSDVFIACDVPTSLSSDDFLNSINNLLTLDGVYIINRSYSGKYKIETDEFVSGVRNQFTNVETENIGPHLIIWAYKK